MTATSVLAATLCRPGPPVSGWVAIADGIIHEVGDGRAPAGAVDLGERLLAPGFIDLQVNGVETIDFARATPDGWTRARRVLAQHGVTAFCPTFVSATLSEYAGMLTRAEEAMADDAPPAGSAILGVHLEGPFLGNAPGAHVAEHIVAVDLEWLEALVHDHPGIVRMVTLAPEADPGFAAIERLVRDGVIVALGHSDASYDQARAAADAGATVVTHLFNGMGPLHHRAPGLVGAALDDDRLTPTLIADLVHVHPAALKLAIARKRNVAVVSDVVATDEAARVDAARLADGRLAGATTLLDGAVANLVSSNVAIDRAIEMASTIPADILALTDRGRIVPGARADLVVLDPTSLVVDVTWIAGDCVHERTAA